MEANENPGTNDRRGTDPEFEREIAEAQRRGLVTVEGGIIKPAAGHKDFKYVSVDQIKKKRVDWLVPGYIPRGQITILAGEGGAGKTTVECSIAAAVTTGSSSFLAQRKGRPENVVFLSGEDSFEYVLRERLEAAKADLTRVFTVDIADDNFKDVKFNSYHVETLVEELTPGLMVFDPVQAFVPGEIHMGERNAMRQTLQPLIAIGKKHGVTFIIAVHTNKQAGVWGRKRIADSADLWDISRSVLIMGEADDNGLRYLSQEKCNLAPLAQTALFKLDSGVIVPEGFSSLHDRDFVGMDRPTRASQAPTREAAKGIILETLSAAGGRMSGKDLAAICTAAGITSRTFERARAEMVKDAEIIYTRAGQAGESIIYIA